MVGSYNFELRVTGPEGSPGGQRSMVSEMTNNVGTTENTLGVKIIIVACYKVTRFGFEKFREY